MKTIKNYQFVLRSIKLADLSIDANDFEALQKNPNLIGTQLFASKCEYYVEKWITDLQKSAKEAELDEFSQNLYLIYKEGELIKNTVKRIEGNKTIIEITNIPGKFNLISTARVIKSDKRNKGEWQLIFN